MLSRVVQLDTSSAITADGLPLAAATSERLASSAASRRFAPGRRRADPRHHRARIRAAQEAVARRVPRAARARRCAIDVRAGESEVPADRAAEAVADVMNLMV